MCLDDKGNTASDFQATISGLAPNEEVVLAVQVLGKYANAQAYVFSWGTATDGAAVHTVSDVGVGTKIYNEEGSSMTTFVVTLGTFTANSSGNLAIWLGNGVDFNSNPFDSGGDDYRTELDGVVVVRRDVAWLATVPENGARGVAIGQTFSWGIPPNYTPAKYEFYIQAAGGSIVGPITTTTNEVTLSTDLVDNTFYTWRVDAYEGTTLHPGLDWSFKTAAVAQTGTYPLDNPIIYNGSIHDVDVFKYNGEYYLTGTDLEGDMFRSRDLENWGERKHIFTPQNTWAPLPKIPHASHVRYVNGLFHFYAQMSSQITHATSPNPYGPYIEQTINSPFAEKIDAEVFIDEYGGYYFYSGYYPSDYAYEEIDYHPMIDPYTLTGSYISMIWLQSGWELTASKIMEAPKVFTYRDQYYLLYNANDTQDASYAIGCTQANSPDNFNNSGKYGYALLDLTTFNDGNGDQRLDHVGQAWVVDGVNGFEKWCGYFAVTDAEGRSQRMERMHFFDRHLYIDGPTNRYWTGYNPNPAKPQLLGLFYLPDGSMPTDDWTIIAGSGTWDIASEEARQLSQSAFAFNTVNREAATNYLIEANVKFIASADGEDKAGVLAYYQDDNNWVIVGLDRSNDSWYCDKKENGVSTVSSGGYSGSVDYTVYHKIRVEKNGSDFRVRIDERIPPNYSGPISTIFSGTGVPGLFTDHTAAAFDGIIYTIGWDEYDSDITGWDDGVVPQVGTWSFGSDGITMAAGTGYTFKCDLMPQYEFTAQVYKVGSTNGRMGLFPVAIDGNNYLYAQIDTAADQLVVGGVKNGSTLTEQTVSVADETKYNIRAVKLADKVILFIDGQEVMTYNVSFGDAQVGLTVNSMSARFNGIMVYRTEPDQVPAGWTNEDIGTVGFPGGTNYSEGTFVINGSGHTIWGAADSFQFGYTPFTGDGEIVVRVVALDSTDSWARAGVMFREDLTDNCKMAYVSLNGGNDTAQFIRRGSVGAETQATNIYGITPGWVKIVRGGDSFSGWYSENGTSWTSLGSYNITMSDTIYVGLAVTAHDNSRICGATFDNVTIIGCTPGDMETDISMDCVVNTDDLMMLADTWLDDVPIDTPEDFDDSLHIDLGDFAIFVNDWIASYDD